MVLLFFYDINGLVKLEEGFIYYNFYKVFQFVIKLCFYKVEVFLLRFRLMQQFFLNNVLEKMGVIDMFSEFKVDFLGISLGLEKFYVFYVIYKVFVEVNEKGIEVVVVIVVVMMG